MMCEFTSLYFGDDGYVVRCKQCAHYQVAFISAVLTLSEHDFNALCFQAARACYEESFSSSPVSKCVIINTPAEGMHLLLTKEEVKRFHAMLEEADNESKALSMIKLFDHGNV